MTSTPDRSGDEHRPRRPGGRNEWADRTGAPLRLATSAPSPGVKVVEMAGELDALTAPQLTVTVREHLTDGLRHLVIDLRSVTFLGSAGLAALIECSHRIDTVGPGTSLRLSGTTHHPVHRALQATGLLPLFTVHPTLAEALTQLSTLAGGDR